jgi:hypothetical protein
MIDKLVWIWILCGSFVALLILNAMTSGGSSAAADDPRADRLGPR